MYLENSKEENLHFYQKHGFIALERMQPFGDSACLWRMLRPMKDPKLPIGEKLTACDVCTTNTTLLMTNSVFMLRKGHDRCESPIRTIFCVN